MNVWYWSAGYFIVGRFSAGLIEDASFGKGRDSKVFERIQCFLSFPLPVLYTVVGVGLEII